MQSLSQRDTSSMQSVLNPPTVSGGPERSDPYVDIDSLRSDAPKDR